MGKLLINEKDNKLMIRKDIKIIKYKRRSKNNEID